MDKRALVDILSASLARQMEWIKLADSKVNFAFAINTAMLGLLAAVSPKTWVSWAVLPSFFAGPAVICCVVSLISNACAMFPRTTWDASKSLVYFGGIADRTPEKFKDSMLALDNEGLVQDLIDQCHRSAQIASIKFLWVQRALFWLFTAAPFWALALWLLFSGSNPSTGLK